MKLFRIRWPSCPAAMKSDWSELRTYIHTCMYLVRSWFYDHNYCILQAELGYSRLMEIRLSSDWSDYAGSIYVYT